MEGKKIHSAKVDPLFFGTWKEEPPFCGAIAFKKIRGLGFILVSGTQNFGINSSQFIEREGVMIPFVPFPQKFDSFPNQKGIKKEGVEEGKELFSQL